MVDLVAFDKYTGWVDVEDENNPPPGARPVAAADLLRYENFGEAAKVAINALIEVTLQDGVQVDVPVGAAQHTFTDQASNAGGMFKWVHSGAGPALHLVAGAANSPGEFMRIDDTDGTRLQITARGNVVLSPTANQIGLSVSTPTGAGTTGRAIRATTNQNSPAIEVVAANGATNAYPLTVQGLNRGVTIQTSGTIATTLNVVHSGGGAGIALAITNNGGGPSIRAVSAGTTTFEVGSDGLLNWPLVGNTQTTVGLAGSAAIPPSRPVRYLRVRDSSGTLLVIPAYRA